MAHILPDGRKVNTKNAVSKRRYSNGKQYVDDGGNKFMELLNSDRMGYQPFSPTNVSESLDIPMIQNYYTSPTMYNNQLSDSGNITLQTSIWTSPGSQHSYMSPENGFAMLQNSSSSPITHGDLNGGSVFRDGLFRSISMSNPSSAKEPADRPRMLSLGLIEENVINSNSNSNSNGNINTGQDPHLLMQQNGNTKTTNFISSHVKGGFSGNNLGYLQQNFGEMSINYNNSNVNGGNYSYHNSAPTTSGSFGGFELSGSIIPGQPQVSANVKANANSNSNSNSNWNENAIADTDEEEDRDSNVTAHTSRTSRTSVGGLFGAHEIIKDYANSSGDNAIGSTSSKIMKTQILNKISSGESDDEFLDFVPSALSDLLTPQELQRRRSSQSKHERPHLAIKRDDEMTFVMD